MVGDTSGSGRVGIKRVTWHRRRAVLVVAGVIALLPTQLFQGAGAANDPADDAIVQAGLFTAADFPTGWTKDPPSGSLAPGPVASSASAKCRALAKKSPDVKAAQLSDEFSNDFDIDFDDTVAVYDTEQTVAAAFTRASSRDRLACYTAGLRKVVKAQSKSGLQRVLSVRRVPPPTSDRSVAYEATFRFRKAGITGTIYAHFILVPVGRAGLTFQFTRIGSPVNNARERSFMVPVIQRVRQAERMP